MMKVIKLKVQSTKYKLINQRLNNPFVSHVKRLQTAVKMDEYGLVVSFLKTCNTPAFIPSFVLTISFICRFTGMPAFLLKHVYLKATVKFDRPNTNSKQKTSRIVLDLTFKVIEIKICVPVVFVFLCLRSTAPSPPLHNSRYKKHTCLQVHSRSLMGVY